MDPGSGRFLRSDDILNFAREVNLLPHDRASKKRRASVNASVRMRVHVTPGGVTPSKPPFYVGLLCEQ